MCIVDFSAYALCRPVSSWNTGPWRENLCVTTTGGPPFTRIVSRAMRSGSHAPRKRTSLRFAGFTSSTYTSAWSVPTIVRPHPILSVWPIITPGNGASVAPMTFQPGALRCTM